MSDQYRQCAFDCVHLAQISTNSEGKLVLLIMARAWIKMAELASRQLPMEEDATANASLELVRSPVRRSNAG